MYSFSPLSGLCAPALSIPAAVRCLCPALTACSPLPQLESAREESAHQKQNGDARQHDEQLRQLTTQLAQHKHELETRRQQQQVSGAADLRSGPVPWTQRGSGGTPMTRVVTRRASHVCDGCM